MILRSICFSSLILSFFECCFLPFLINNFLDIHHLSHQYHLLSSLLTLVLSFCIPNNHNNLIFYNGLPLHFPNCPSINQLPRDTGFVDEELLSSYLFQLSPNIFSFWIDRYTPFTTTRIFTETMRSHMKTFQHQ